MAANEAIQAPDPEISEHEFGHRLKGLRTRLFVKQAILSSEIRCTEAAISYWESSRRLPLHARLLTILAVFAHRGATQMELDELRCAWQRAVIRRMGGPAVRLP